MLLSKKQKKEKVVVPKGMSRNGKSYHCEDDLMNLNLNRKVCIRDLPVDGIPFMLDPNHKYSQTMDKDKGQLIHIYAVSRSGTK